MKISTEITTCMDCPYLGEVAKLCSGLYGSEPAFLCKKSRNQDSPGAFYVFERNAEIMIDENCPFKSAENREK